MADTGTQNQIYLQLKFHPHKPNQRVLEYTEDKSQGIIIV